MARKKDNQESEEKILDVNASMQGTITFKDPVNLRINGTFEGKLDTRGILTIGDSAKVKANITGDKIIIAGKVTGDITAYTSLTLAAPASVEGNVSAPIFSCLEGAILDGNVAMSTSKANEVNFDNMTVADVAGFLEVEEQVVEEWASKKKIPATLEEDGWVFERSQIERWIQEEKVNS